jgi:predicted lipoprotein with Yx(FWY)xxD motif
MGGRFRWNVLAGLLVAAIGVGGAMAATMSSRAGTVKAAQNATYGSLLVTASGMTLYRYTPEKKGAVKCTGACASFWPPLVVSGNTKPTAGAGASAGKLSTVKRSNGTRQVTYGGFALYRYAADKKPGDVKGQGVEGKWFAVTSTGALAVAKKGGVSPPTTPPPTTTDPGYGGAYGP